MITNILIEMSTRIKLYASMIYLFLMSLPSIFVMWGTALSPLAIVHFIVSMMILLWFLMYEVN